MFENKVKYTYYRHDDLIIGIDQSDLLIKCYVKKPCSKGNKAFGGRKFEIKLQSGEIIECHGQWWDGGYNKAAEKLGKELIRVAYKDKRSLKDCYVFRSAKAIKNKLDNLIKDYDGKVYKHDEYREILKGE